MKRRTQREAAQATSQRERELIAAAWRDSVAIASAKAVPPPQEPVAGYRLVREIGRGGMGVVYEAEQEQPQRAVALKMIGGGALASDHRVRLFEREIQTLARLRHPAIAAIYEAGRTERGRPFFTMELVRGTRLTEYARLEGLSRRARLQLFRRICEAVHYAHQRGVIHRDLKPSNVVIDVDGNPKILDFGLARIGGDSEEAVSTASLEVGKIMGTLPYMSPEQARVRPDEIPSEVDVRSDVYSLGVILYELLTGHLPYEVTRAMPHEALRIICEAPARRPSTWDRALRGDLDTILLKALAKEPGRRYDSAAALAEDIERHLKHEPIRAQPPSFLYLVRKWIVRHQVEFVLLVMFFVVIPAFVALLWIQSARTQAAIRAARQPIRDSAEWAYTVPLRDEAHNLETVALGLMKDGRYEPAMWLLRSCRQLRIAALGEDHTQTVVASSLLGECLARQGRFEEAERYLLEAFDRLVHSDTARRLQKIVALRRVIELYERWGRPDEAQLWRGLLAVFDEWYGDARE